MDIQIGNCWHNSTGAASLHLTGYRHPSLRLPSYLNLDEEASPSRIQYRSRWRGLEEFSRLAVITVLVHGGHERPIITRGGKHLRSRMGSRKTGLQQLAEGRAHRDLIMLNEVDPDVLDYQAHPFKMEFQQLGKPEVYYPDHIRSLSDGTIELIEVKRSEKDLADTDYCAKLGAVAEIARRVGWVFRVLYHNEITGCEDRLDNVQAIYTHRFMRLSRSEQLAISEFVARDEPCSWDELRELVCSGDKRRGEAALRCNIALGRISVNLDQQITATTKVLPCRPVSRVRSIRL